MKLVTYELGKQPRVGVVEGDKVVDVRTAMELISRRRVSRTLAARPAFKAATRSLVGTGFAPRSMIEVLGRGPEWQKSLGVVTKSLAGAVDPSRAPKGLFTPLTSARLRAPIARPSKIVCVGLNYADHAHEQHIEPPEKPVFFLKSVNTISAPGDPIVLPVNSDKIDYEAEFAVVIGKGGKNIPEEKALEHVAGYMIMNDVTARDMQKGDGQWFRGKSCDTFGPCGPWITTRDEISDPDNLKITLTLNGRILQNSNTSNLVFKVPYLISYLSQSMSWEVGDVISTGTPAGVGVFLKPPVFLKAGDSVTVSVERLGELTNPVVGPLSVA